MIDISLEQYLENIHRVEAIDIDWFKQQIKINQQHTNNALKPRQPDMHSMLTHWQNNQDTGVYGWPAYIIEAWSCWRGYSRRYIKDLIKLNLLEADSIADLGCGFGQTTVAIKTHCPSARVTATNVEDTLQWKVASNLAQQYNFSVDSELTGRYELIFASEYFEHIKRPIEHLEQIIATNQPEKFIIANSFGTLAVGHYKEYLHGEQQITAKEASRLFNRTLELNGYKSIKHGLWNNRPRIWQKQ